MFGAKYEADHAKPSSTYTHVSCIILGQNLRLIAQNFLQPTRSGRNRNIGSRPAENQTQTHYPTYLCLISSMYDFVSAVPSSFSAKTVS